MQVSFNFFDFKFDNKNDYAFDCEMESIPRVGDEVWLPGLDGGGPLRYEQLTADRASVEAVIWMLADEDITTNNVTIHCDIKWDE